MLLSFASMTAGCRVEITSSCSPSYCEGAVLHRCERVGEIPSAQWTTVSCSFGCVPASASTGDAHCTTSVPSSECKQDGLICYQGGLANCRAGNLEMAEPCSSGGPCVPATTTREAFCAASAAPIPECQQDGDICYQGAVAACSAGYLKSSTACDPGHVCVAVGRAAKCVLSSTLDSRCGDPANELFRFCNANMLFECWYGYLVSVDNCLSQCVVGPSGTSC